jgi:predicted  nucleic acid-binding Zn-ribbon protein
VRRLREQPRVVVASVVGLLALFAAGLLIGIAVGDDRDEVDAAKAHAAAAERRVGQLRHELDDANARLDDASSSLHAARARVGRLERRNARLRRQLRQARRAAARVRDSAR